MKHQSIAICLLLLGVPVIARAGNNASFVAQSIPATLEAGGVYRVEMTFKNTGTTVWKENGGVGSFRLGSRNPDNNTIWRTINRVMLSPSESVLPGARKTFVFDIVAPRQPGRYPFQWGMVHEGVGHWFGSKSRNASITVNPAPGALLDVLTRNGKQIGLRQLTFQGQRLLTGGGVYGICSRDGGADNPHTNFGTEQSPDGLSMGNDVGEKGPPFQLQFTQTSPTTVRFVFDTGPVSQTVYEANVAMDFDLKQITSWSFDGRSYREGGCNDYRSRTGSSGTFSAVRSPCPLVVDGKRIGFVGIVATGTSPSWWKVTGPGGTVRVTVDKSSARNLKSAGFTRHPYTHNIGFSFGRLDRGQAAHLEGTIEVGR